MMGRKEIEEMFGKSIKRIEEDGEGEGFIVELKCGRKLLVTYDGWIVEIGGE